MAWTRLGLGEYTRLGEKNRVLKADHAPQLRGTATNSWLELPFRRRQLEKRRG